MQKIMMCVPISSPHAALGHRHAFVEDDNVHSNLNDSMTPHTQTRHQLFQDEHT